MSKKSQITKGKDGLTKLSELDANEVSLVPRGANKKKFIVLKSAGGNMPLPQKNGAPPMSPLHQAIAHPDPEVMKKVDGLIQKYAGVKKDSDMEPPAPVQTEVGGPELGTDAQSAIKAVVRILAPFKGKISPNIVHEVLDVAGHEMGGGDNEGDEDLGGDHSESAGASHIGDGTQHGVAGHKEAGFMAIPEKIEGIEKGHMDEAVDKAQSAYKEHMEKLGYRKYPDAQMAMKSQHDGASVEKTKGEPVAKSDTTDLSKVDPKIREAIQKSDNRAKEAVEKADRLEAQIKARDEADKKKEIVQKAASFSHLGLPQDEIVAQLEDASKLGEKSYERVCKSFETLNSQARSSRLFGEIGSSLSASQGTDDYDAKIKRLADGIVQKSGDTKLTSAAAYEIAASSPEGQRLYAEYKANRKDGI